MAWARQWPAGWPPPGVTAVVADLNEEQGKAVAAETGGVFVKTDVADENSVTAAVETAAAQGAPLRIVVNCAGIGWAARTVGRDGYPARSRGLPQGHRRQPDRHVQPDAHRRGGHGPDRARRRGQPARRGDQHLLGGRPGRPDRPGRLLGLQGRHHRDDRAGRPRPGRHRRPGEHHLPRHHRHPDLRVRAGRRGVQGQAGRAGGRSRSGWAPRPSSPTWCRRSSRTTT